MWIYIDVLRLRSTLYGTHDLPSLFISKFRDSLWHRRRETLACLEHCKSLPHTGSKSQIHTLTILCRIRCCITCHRIDQVPGFYKSRLLLGCKLMKSLPLCSMAPFTLLILIFLSDSFDVQFEFQSTILFWLSNPISDVWNGFNMHASSNAYSLKDCFYLLTIKS